jgi:hypothetical protein
MNLIGFKSEPGGGFYLRLRGSCRLLSHSSAILQPQVPMATGQGKSIRASAPYSAMAFSLRDTLKPCSRRDKVERTMPCFSPKRVYGIGLSVSVSHLSVTASSSNIVALRYWGCKMGWFRCRNARYERTDSSYHQTFQQASRIKRLT